VCELLKCVTYRVYLYFFKKNFIKYHVIRHSPFAVEMIFKSTQSVDNHFRLRFIGTKLFRKNDNIIILCAYTEILSLFCRVRSCNAIENRFILILDNQLKSSYLSPINTYLRRLFNSEKIRQQYQYCNFCNLLFSPL